MKETFRVIKDGDLKVIGVDPKDYIDGMFGSVRKLKVNIMAGSMFEEGEKYYYSSSGKYLQHRKSGISVPILSYNIVDGLMEIIYLFPNGSNSNLFDCDEEVGVFETRTIQELPDSVILRPILEVRKND